MNSAHDISTPLNPKEKTSYNFNIDGPKLAAELRALAEKIEKREVAVQSAIVYSRAQIDDFTMTAVVLKYAEKMPITQNEAVAELRGHGSPFPVAVSKVPA